MRDNRILGTYIHGSAPATQKQINYAKKLIEELGYDLDDYELEKMTHGEMINLLGDLQQELG